MIIILICVVHLSNLGVFLDSDFKVFIFFVVIFICLCPGEVEVVYRNSSFSFKIT